jgi:penicillin-insensitive murein endopeptidase
MRTTTLFVISTVLVALSPRMGESAPASTCYGTTSRGRLENGVKLPARGASFQAYSLVLAGVGRTYVHSRVHDVVVGAYVTLAKSHSGVVFVYGETGFETGGRFKPHKTHQNGLSVDFMVPVRNDRNKSVPLPTSPFNKYGYGIDIWRVIVDPRLQPHLYCTPDGPYLKTNILVPPKRSWVRHDDHYHVDFKMKFKPL